MPFGEFSNFIKLLALAQAVEPVLGDTGTLFWLAFKMLLTLGTVCLLAFFTLRYGLPRLGNFGGNSELMRVVARQPLDAQKSLCIVEVGGKHLLLAITMDRIELLTELDSTTITTQIANLETRLAQRPNPLKEFSKYLRKE
jgi:flagellar biosynthetic protein FliO